MIIAIPIILTALITFVITAKHILKVYVNTIKHKNELIDKLAEENGLLREKINKIEYDTNRKIL